ncbi:MAG: DUF2235 domain-containing protein [Acidimicrobiia bacterium]
MTKNIVLCLDGTGNQVKADQNTNVVRLYEMLDLSDPDRQIAFYDPGVGTFSASGAWTRFSRWLTRMLGLAFGYGIKTNLAEAYTFLIDNYQPGDKIYVFGFSRGAFTARGLAGMSYRAGLLRRGAENLVSYLVSHFTRGDRWSEEDWGRIDRYASTFSVRTDGKLSLPIHFLGLWDSVKALGYLRWNPKWPYTRKLLNARHVRHAVSIDEKRRPYAEYLVEDSAKIDLDEVWFAGVHSDIGGTFADEDRLSRISLKWMTDRAIEAGVLIRPGAYRKECRVDRSDAVDGLVHRMGWVWALLTYRRRPIATYGEGRPRIHASVRDRLAGRQDYRIDIDRDGFDWADENWTHPHPRTGGETARTSRSISGPTEASN